MTKLQIVTLIVNFALTTQIFRKMKALDNAGGEDAMSLTIETCFYIAALVVFDVVALIVHLWVK